MSLPRLFFLFAGCLFLTIIGAAYWKKSHAATSPSTEVALTLHGEESGATVSWEVDLKTYQEPAQQRVIPERALQKEQPVQSIELAPEEQQSDWELSPASVEERLAALPNADRIEELFNIIGPKLPYVTTISYKSQVPWVSGRPAWIVDYANHYNTSRHFIARSLNGQPDYLKQDVVEGSRFNVFSPDAQVSFHLVIDLSLCHLWLYSIDDTTGERILLKRYPVCLGKPDSNRYSHSKTPIGCYTLGKRVATYKPKMFGIYRGERIEWIRVFGTRWIPFDKELEGCSAPAQGFGIHGMPWIDDPSGGALHEDLSSLCSYASDGCIRLKAADVEELFAILITKEATVQIVRNFSEAKF